MAQDRVQTVLQRKAEAGRPAADGAPLSAERVIAQALARAGQELFELPVQVLSSRETRRTLSDLPEALEELSLLAILEGPGEGLGLAALSPAALSALIEVQTMGALAKAAPAARKPTRIDATMVADYLDAVLSMIEEGLAETEAVIWAGGFRYASYLDDPRPLGLLLEDVTYRTWQVEIGFGAGAERRGSLLWAVPVNGRGQALRRLPGAASGPAATPTEAAAQPPAEPDWGARLEASVLGAPATLDAVLHRVTLPLAAVMGLRPGMQLPIPADALENIVLEGAGRRRLSAARLGQHRGQRALRLIEEEDAAADAPAAAPPPRPAKVVPPPFTAGESPFAGRKPARAAKGPLDRIDSPAYDPAPDEGFGGFGGTAGLSPGGDMPPLGMALDGFGADPDAALPPLKLGTGL